MLVCILLIVKREEQGVEVIVAEVVGTIEHGNGGVSRVALRHSHLILGVLCPLVPRLRYVSV